MKSSPLFMEIWSFETIHCLKYDAQRQTRHDDAQEVKAYFLVLGFIGCMKSMLFLAIIFLLSVACGQWNKQKSLH